MYFHGTFAVLTSKIDKNLGPFVCDGLGIIGPELHWEEAFLVTAENLRAFMSTCKSSSSVSTIQ